VSSEPITLERFAAIAAEIEHGAAPPEVLAREGIDEATWEEAQEEWMSKLAEETAEQESSDLNTRYQKAYGERLAALEKEARERPAPPAKPADDQPGSGYSQIRIAARTTARVTATAHRPHLHPRLRPSRPRPPSRSDPKRAPWHSRRPLNLSATRSRSSRRRTSLPAPPRRLPCAGRRDLRGLRGR
jgi:hypothetical protein